MNAYLPHSLNILDCPISTASRFPNAQRHIKKFKARDALLVPNTFLKKILAATTSEFRISSLLAAEK